MELFNLLLTTVNIPFYGKTFEVSLNWIGTLVRWLISGVGIVGVGIIVFSLILKFVVLPLDIYQRISMRKQNNKMQENQDRMQKLQKQYANDKDAYNKKVAEMYRESGLSMMSSCLPMILSMAIFIIAINGFNAYAQFSNVQNYNDMVGAYNAKIQAIATDLESQGISCKENDAQNGYIVYLEDLEDETTGHAEIKAAITAANAVTQAEKIIVVQNYFKNKAQDAVVEEYKTNIQNRTNFLWIKNIWATDASYKHPVLTYSDFKTEISRGKFVVGTGKGTLNDVITAAGSTNTPYDELAYNTITGKLSQQKAQANGYYILIALSIGTILLQQWITNRSQKAQQQFATVDSTQAASQQKTTMFIMTAMFAVFAFYYSAAFSIYMIVSNVTSLISTIVINKLVDRALEKKEAEEIKAQYNKRLGHLATTKPSDKTSNKK